MSDSMCVFDRRPWEEWRVNGEIKTSLFIRFSIIRLSELLNLQKVDVNSSSP